MKMSDTVHIPAPPTAVWDGLNNPEILKESIPGCQEIVQASPTEFTAKAAVAIGPVKATFSGKVTLSDMDPPNGYRISGEGTGGAAGFAKGSALVKLTPSGDGTDLAYDVDANVGGKIAQIGQRFIDQTAKKMADDFFKRFAAAVSAPAEEAPGEEPEPAEVPAQAAAMAPAAEPFSPEQTRPSSAEGKNKGLPLLIGGVLVVLAALVVLYKVLS